jgi:hypothetical protein
MNKKNQILLVKEFISSNDEALLINQVNDEIAIFYLSIIKYYANNQVVKFNINAHTDTPIFEDDLFGTKILQVYNLTNTKKIDALLNDNIKKLIFTDYKNYKRLSSKFNCVNGYQFEKDIAFFIKSELGINSEELLFYCQNNPALLLSETSKYLINSNYYSSDHSLIDDKNHILEIRKEIFESKRSNLNIKNLYQNIKKEVKYKKLSFLTF